MVILLNQTDFVTKSVAKPRLQFNGAVCFKTFSTSNICTSSDLKAKLARLLQFPRVRIRISSLLVAMARVAFTGGCKPVKVL